MSKKYTQQDILQMAAHLQEQDLAADVNKDGVITSEDAWLAQDGVEVPDPATRMSADLLDKLLTMQDYSYDLDSDPLYGYYREMYEKAGSRAAENAFGLASAYTGGYGSSYASTVANDAYALYMDKLAAKGAALEQQAYDRYRDARSDLYRQYLAAAELEDRQYGRDRDMKEDSYREDELALQEQEATLKAQEAERNSLNDMIRFAFDAAGKGDYSYLAALGVDTSALTQKDALEAAEIYAKYGDLSGLEALGVDVSSLEQEAEREKAAFYAEYGDLSGLRALGVDVSRLRKDQLFDVASLFAKYGDYSLLRLLV